MFCPEKSTKFNKIPLSLISNKEDHDGSEASVSVFTNLSLYPVKSIDHNFAEKPWPFSSVLVSL